LFLLVCGCIPLFVMSRVIVQVRPREIGDHLPMAGHPIFSAIYDRLLASSEHAGLAEMRKSVLERASGRTLELGAGTGANAAHYPAAVTEAVLTEPDPHMARRLRDRLASEPPGFAYEVVETGAEQLPFDDDSFDAVISTLVLCTVDDPARVAAEVARVLRPDGSLLLLEHVRDPDDGRLGGWQDRLQAPWGWFSGGCNPNRDTAATLAAAGFDVSDLEPAEFPKAPPLARPMIQGSARSATG
jgi:SAM-dependent methyltransferase